MHTVCESSETHEVKPRMHGGHCRALRVYWHTRTHGQACVPHLPKTCMFCTCLCTRVRCTRAHITTAPLHKHKHMSMAGAQHTPMQLSRTLESNTAVCPTRTKGCGRGVAVEMHVLRQERTHRGVGRRFIPLHHINSKLRKRIMGRCPQPCPNRSAPRPGRWCAPPGLRVMQLYSYS